MGSFNGVAIGVYAVTLFTLMVAWASMLSQYNQQHEIDTAWRHGNCSIYNVTTSIYRNPYTGVSYGQLFYCIQLRNQTHTEVCESFAGFTTLTQALLAAYSTIIPQSVNSTYQPQQQTTVNCLYSTASPLSTLTVHPPILPSKLANRLHRAWVGLFVTWLLLALAGVPAFFIIRRVRRSREAALRMGATASQPLRGDNTFVTYTATNVYDSRL